MELIDLICLQDEDMKVGRILCIDRFHGGPSCDIYYIASTTLWKAEHLKSQSAVSSR